MAEKWVVKPNLPGSSVCCVITAQGCSGLVQALSDMGIRTVCCAPLPGIKGSEASHADMSFCHVGGDMLFAARDLSDATKTAVKLESPRLIYTKKTVTAEDPLLNVCIVGSTVFANVRRTDPGLLDLLCSRDYSVCHVNQRYARCSVAVVSERAIITSDESVISKAKELDFDVLRISQGHIFLKGYPYGFIGGCCGLLGPDILAFSGNISLHPDYDNIRSFALDHHVHILSLTDGPLCDVGGILPIKTNQHH